MSKLYKQISMEHVIMCMAVLGVFIQLRTSDKYMHGNKLACSQVLEQHASEFSEDSVDERQLLLDTDLKKVRIWSILPLKPQVHVWHTKHCWSYWDLDGVQIYAYLVSKASQFVRLPRARLFLSTDFLLLQVGVPCLPTDINHADYKQVKGPHVLQVVSATDACLPSKGGSGSSKNRWNLTRDSTWLRLHVHLWMRIATIVWFLTIMVSKTSTLGCTTGMSRKS